MICNFKGDKIRNVWFRFRFKYWFHHDVVHLWLELDGLPDQLHLLAPLILLDDADPQPQVGHLKDLVRFQTLLLA